MKNRIILLAFAVIITALTFNGCAVMKMVKGYPGHIVHGADAYVNVQYDGPPGGTQDFYVHFKTESGLDLCGGSAVITVEPAIVLPVSAFAIVTNSCLQFTAHHKTRHAIINLSYAGHNYIYDVSPGDTTIAIPIQGGC
jgi:hypothetical protein